MYSVFECDISNRLLPNRSEKGVTVFIVGVVEKNLSSVWELNNPFSLIVYLTLILIKYFYRVKACSCSKMAETMIFIVLLRAYHVKVGNRRMVKALLHINLRTVLPKHFVGLANYWVHWLVKVRTLVKARESSDYNVLKSFQRIGC